MAETLIIRQYTFQSGTGSDIWYFTVAVDVAGSITVRNIQGPTGAYSYDLAPIPASVVEDMNTAIELVRSGQICSSGITGITGSTGFYVL